MNIVVLIAGVHDPKWPIALAGQAVAPAGSEHLIMSPFDEAALEMALRVRDANSGAHISVHVGGSLAGTRIARTVAALNITDVDTVALDHLWDQAATARALVPLCADADLILIGREFGDFDDGLVPALLAAMLDVPFFGRAQAIETGDGVRLVRETDACVETMNLTLPTLASVTNDRRTRLRKPLMKNVMLARQARIDDVTIPVEQTAGLAMESLIEGASGRNRIACNMIAGAPEQQARALATLLWEARS